MPAVLRTGNYEQPNPVELNVGVVTRTGRRLFLAAFEYTGGFNSSPAIFLRAISS
jgi:hypothetical protein